MFSQETPGCLWQWSCKALEKHTLAVWSCNIHITSRFQQLTFFPQECLRLRHRRCLLNDLLHHWLDADSWVWSQALHLQIILEQSYSSNIILEQSYMLKPKLQKTTRVCHTVVTIILQPLDMRVPQQPTKIQQFLPQS